MKCSGVRAKAASLQMDVAGAADAPASAEDHASKRRRKERDQAFTSQGHVNLKCMLDPMPQSVIQVERSLLAHWNPAIYRTVKWYKPERDEDGLEFYRVTATYKTLKCMIYSMITGRMVANDPDELSEVLAFLQYQGICFHGPERATYDAKMIRDAEGGVGFVKTTDYAVQKLRHLCEVIAISIASWPFLDEVRECLDGGEVAYTCTCTTAWITFVKKPARGVPHRGAYPASEILELAKAQPVWLMLALMAIGMKFHELVKKKHVENVWNGASCTSLFLALDQDPLGMFAFTRHSSIGKTLARNGMPRRKYAAAKQFAHDVTSVVEEALGQNENDEPAVPAGGTQLTLTPEAQLVRNDREDAVKFARACIGWTDDKFRKMADLQKLFGMYGCNSKGESKERTVLAEALKARNIRVVHWFDQTTWMQDPKTVVGFGPVYGVPFPPQYVENPESLEQCEAGHASVMIEFVERE